MPVHAAGPALRAVLVAALAALVAAPAAAGAVEIDLRARAVEPGEPVRIVARAGAAIADLDGTFLGRMLSFHPEEPRTWTAWALVPLDQDATTTAIEVSGRAVDGTAIAGTRAVTVAAKAFPEERLQVSSKYVEPPPEVARRIASERERVREIYAKRTPPTDRGVPFVRPVPGEPTSVFGTRRLFNGQPRSPHPGLDLRAATGTPVRAAGPGTVVLADDLYYSGNLVIVDHGGGLFTLYAHLSGIDVVDGDVVEAGAVVGRSGATGRVTGPHLHWGAKIGDEPFDPRALLAPELFGR